MAKPYLYLIGFVSLILLHFLSQKSIYPTFTGGDTADV